MGIVFRQSVKTILVLFTGAILGAGIIFSSIRYLPKQEFGFIRNLTNQALMFSQIAVIGLTNTLSVFIHNYEGLKKKVLITLSFFIPTIILIVLTIFYFLFKKAVIHHFQPQDIPFITRYYIWLPIFTLFFLFQILFEQLLNSQMKIAMVAFYKEIVLRALNLVLLFLFGFSYIDYTQFIIYTVLTYGFISLVYAYLAKRLPDMGISTNFRLIRNSEYKEMLRFATYHALLNVTLNIISVIDLLLLPFYDKDGLSIIPVYSVAVFILSFALIPYKSMLVSSFPPLTKAYRDRDIPHFKDLFLRSSINIQISVLFTMILIACSLNNALLILNAKGYDQLILLVLILMIGRLIDTSTGSNDQVLSITNYYNFSLYMSILIIIIAFILNRILIPKYGVYGAAWSATLVYLIFNSAKLIFIWIKFKMLPFSRDSIKILVTGSITTLAGYFLPFVANPYVDTVARSLVIFVTYLGMLILLKPSPDLKEYLANIRKNRRLF